MTSVTLSTLLAAMVIGPMLIISLLAATVWIGAYAYDLAASRFA